jgi:hypothetical protein
MDFMHRSCDISPRVWGSVNNVKALSNPREKKMKKIREKRHRDTEKEKRTELGLESTQKRRSSSSFPRPVSSSSSTFRTTGAAMR